MSAAKSSRAQIIEGYVFATPNKASPPHPSSFDLRRITHTLITPGRPIARRQAES